MVDFGELKHRKLREVWPHEAADFTPWLADNLDRLGETLGMDLELVGREVAVGGFSVDLVAKDLGTHGTVIIENQLTATDHDHLGKLLTYGAGHDAAVVVWVAESIRAEHREALDWLNERTDANTAFFAIVPDVLQIDDSRLGFTFKVVVSPNEWQKRTRPSRTTPRQEAYRAFFQALIDELREEHHYTRARQAQAANWYNFASGVSGVYFLVNFGQRDRVRTEVSIDQGDKRANKALFDWLLEQRQEIETELGHELTWERLEEKQSSRIALYRPGSIEDDQETLNEIRAWAVQHLLAFREVFGPRLKKHRAGE
jgi:hypothetical protein